MSITGNYLDAGTALAWGLVNEVVPHDELLPRCRAIAADIVGNDQKGLRRIVQTYDLGGGATEEHAWEIERAVSFQWFVAGVDPADVEARRSGVVERGRSQQG
jgi:enoyl-CoA hydratase